MQFPNIDPIFLRIGPIQLRWYGLMYIIGFVAGYFVILAGVQRKKLSVSRENISDLICWTAMGVIIGGRLGYVLFYNLPYYLAHPLHVFAIWEGGMSFHGGFIGLALMMFIFARKHGIAVTDIADLIASAAPIGLGLGRIGNFINGELYGRVTHLPWGVVFPEGGILPRHPSQLYEAFLEGPILFTIIYLITRRKYPAGFATWVFITGYGLFRFCVEFLREPDAQVGFFWGVFSMGQLLSLPMILTGIIMMTCLLRHETPVTPIAME